MAENAKSAVGGPVFAGNPDGRNGQLHSARDAAGNGCGIAFSHIFYRQNIYHGTLQIMSPQFISGYG